MSDLSTTHGPVGTSPRTDLQTRTGIRVRQFVDDVKADLSDMGVVLREARQRAAALEEDGRGINGLSASCRGWGQQIEKILKDIEEERAEVERKMLGTGRAIAVSVDEDLRERIRVARSA